MLIKLKDIHGQDMPHLTLLNTKNNMAFQISEENDEYVVHMLEKYTDIVESEKVEISQRDIHLMLSDIIPDICIEPTSDENLNNSRYRLMNKVLSFENEIDAMPIVQLSYLMSVLTTKHIELITSIKPTSNKNIQFSWSNGRDYLDLIIKPYEFKYNICVSNKPIVTNTFYSSKRGNMGIAFNASKFIWDLNFLILKKNCISVIL